jgi:hypothetical protein
VLLELFEQYDLANKPIASLDSFDEAAVRGVIIMSVAQSIYLRWLQDLGRSIEKGSRTECEAVRLEREVRAYVRDTLVLDLTKYDVLRIDWPGRQGQEIVQRIYTEAYEFLEVTE